MNDIIYLDNNATTKVDEDVYNSIIPYFKELYGNPSSIYSFSKQIKNDIKNSRKQVATLLNAESEEILFTSCATESNITAIMSAVKNNPNKKHIITTKVEHSSILETMKELENQGYNVTYLSVDENGKLDLNEYIEAINDDTILVTVMLANNEIGNIYPIKEMAQIAHNKGILFHCDAVQAIGKIKVDVKDLDVDTLSFAGHKINAPKGVGALYVKNGVHFNSLIYGHQENNKRGGTENVPYIIGLGKACEIIYNDNFQTEKKILELRDYMEAQIKDNIPDIHIYGDLENRIPNTSSIGFKGIKNDELFFVLESYNIFVSTGSACNSEIALPSHVLVACNADMENYSPIRISLGKYNTKEEIDIFIASLTKVVNMLRRLKEKRNV